MQGRYVVWMLLGGVAVLAAFSWWWALDVKSRVDAQAAEYGVEKLSREEAAARVAREDRFGLQSRLPNAPERDIERFRKVGTLGNPLTPDEQGVRTLIEVNAVSVEQCAKIRRLELPADLELEVVVGHKDERAVVANVRAVGQQGEEWTGFERCLTGALQYAVFWPPESSNATVAVPAQPGN